MTTVELIMAVEQGGGCLHLDDQLVHYRLPQPIRHLLPDLRQQRDDVRRVLQQRLADAVAGWISKRCVISWRCASNPVVLHREFARWSGMQCSVVAFVAEVTRRGLLLGADGMILGLALGADFIAGLEYERDRTV